MKRGQRIKLVSTSDPYTRLQPGDTGTVTRVSTVTGTVHVKWDSGSTLGLIEDEDEWDEVDDDTASE